MFYFYFLMLVVFAKTTVIYGFNQPRIGNGEITPPDLFQFIVKLHTGGFCTGTIISKRHILTAAHCINENFSMKAEHDTYKLYSNILYSAEVRPIAKGVDISKLPTTTTAYLPKSYTWAQWPWNDLAILEFPEGTDFGIEPVKLAKDYTEKEGDEAYISGVGFWYTNDDPEPKRSQVLRHTKISMNENCFGKLHICGGNLTHLAVSGDSGGPMMIHRNNQWYEIGVSAKTLDYDYRTRISSYCNFIEEVTKNEAKCEPLFPVLNQKIPLQFPPIYKGQETPLKLFDFVIPLYHFNYFYGCTATVISKRHLLTASFCTYQNWRTKDSELTFFNSYKSFSSKFFPDFRSKSIRLNIVEPVNATVYIPLKLKWPKEHNLVVIEFPEGTDFGVEPITLAKDHIQTYMEDLIVVGYGKYELKYNMHIDGTPPKLQHTNVPFQIDRYYDKNVAIENKVLYQDEGGPTLIERNGKLYQITVNFIEGTPNGSRTVISRDCNFIEEVTKNEVKCESVAPMYFQSTTISDNSKPSNNASLTVFQWILLIFMLTVFRF